MTTFLYDDFGAVTNETVVGVAGTNTIERYWDAYGRTVGYSLNGTRQTTIGLNQYTSISNSARRQPLPPPEVPGAQTSSEVRVKAVERNPAAVVAPAALAAQTDFLI